MDSHPQALRPLRFVLNQRASGSERGARFTGASEGNSSRSWVPPSATTVRRMARVGDSGAHLEETGERVVGAQDETKWAPLTTEFWAMFLLVIGILIAAAISDSPGDRRAWTLVTVISAAYILSRGRLALRPSFRGLSFRGWRLYVARSESPPAPLRSRHRGYRPGRDDAHARPPVHA